jgi:hypothetical protein
MSQQTAAAIVLCTWTKPGGVKCQEPASHTFRWEWGEEGKCCPACIALVQQTGVNLNRSVSVTPLGPAVEQPVSRSERTQLIAAKLSAEAELAEVVSRAEQLYNSNVDLTKQVQTHTMRAREHATIVSEKDNQIGRLSRDLERREQELADATAELQRLRLLSQFAPEQTERSRTQQPEG